MNNYTLTRTQMRPFVSVPHATDNDLSVAFIFYQPLNKFESVIVNKFGVQIVVALCANRLIIFFSFPTHSVTNCWELCQTVLLFLQTDAVWWFSYSCCLHKTTFFVCFCFVSDKKTVVLTISLRCCHHRIISAMD